MSPADSRMMSPGTSWSIGSSSQRLSPCSLTTRSTVAVLLTIAFSASAALVERASWMKLSSVEIPTIRAITPAANRSSVE